MHEEVQIDSKAQKVEIPKKGDALTSAKNFSPLTNNIIPNSNSNTQVDFKTVKSKFDAMDETLKPLLLD